MHLNEKFTNILLEYCESVQYSIDVEYYMREGYNYKHSNTTAINNKLEQELVTYRHSQIETI